MIITIHIFITLIVLFGVGIILITKNIVHAAYALCLTLIGVAAIYILQFAELLAVVQIMLYAGGVVILLVFGVMMTNRLRNKKVESDSTNKVSNGLLSVALFAGLGYAIGKANFTNSKIDLVDQVKAIGVSFLTNHIVAFELIAFILLVALVGAAYLAKHASNE